VSLISLNRSRLRHSRAAGSPWRARQRLAQAFVELAPMHKAGQLIVRREMADPRLRNGGAADVGADAAEAGQPPCPVVHRPAADLEVLLGALGIEDPELEALERPAPDQIRPMADPPFVVDHRTARPPWRPLPGECRQKLGRVL
jgi:hypothetical protein